MIVMVAGSPVTEECWPRREQGLDLRLHDVLAQTLAEEGLRCRHVNIEPHHIHSCSVELHVTEPGTKDHSEPTVLRLDHDQVVARLGQFATRLGHNEAEHFYHAGMYFVILR